MPQVLDLIMGEVELPNVIDIDDTLIRMELESCYDSETSCSNKDDDDTDEGNDDNDDTDAGNEDDNDDNVIEVYNSKATIDWPHHSETSANYFADRLRFDLKEVTSNYKLIASAFEQFPGNLRLLY